jgi:hypothetical protein
VRVGIPDPSTADPPLRPADPKAEFDGAFCAEIAAGRGSSSTAVRQQARSQETDGSAADEHGEAANRPSGPGAEGEISRDMRGSGGHGC